MSESAVAVTGTAPEEETSSARRTGLIVVNLILISGAIIMVFPFFWQTMTAFKSFGESIQVPPVVFPSTWVWNFDDVMESIPFAQMFTNSVVMTIIRTLGQVLLCTMAGYAFARMPFPGSNIIFILFLSVMMVPPQLYLLPQFEIMERLGWLNTMQALVLPGMFSAFGVFLMRQFFAQLPKELEESARLDGCNPWQVFWKVMLPLARPGMAALVVFSVLTSWNDLLWPLVVTTDPEKMPLTVGLAQMVGLHTTNFPLLMSATLLATLPMLILFMVLQRQFIQGIAFSGMKG